MGYYTSYTLEVESFESSYIDELEVIDEFRNKYDNAGYALSKKGDTEESCTWYDHEKDLLEFSKLYPFIKFTLKGEGEEAGDLWIKYFIAGVVQDCRPTITYPEFDPKLFESAIKRHTESYIKRKQAKI